MALASNQFFSNVFCINNLGFSEGSITSPAFIHSGDNRCLQCSLNIDQNKKSLHLSRMMAFFSAILN